MPAWWFGTPDVCGCGGAYKRWHIRLLTTDSSNTRRDFDDATVAVYFAVDPQSENGGGGRLNGDGRGRGLEPYPGWQFAF